MATLANSAESGAAGFRLEGPRLVSVYERWRRLARVFLRAERGDLTLGPTDMAHQAYLGLRSARFRDTHHAIAAGAQAMRRLLVSHARRKLASRRGSGAVHVPLIAESASELTASAGFGGASPTYLASLIDLDDAMLDLSRVSPRLHEVVELRYFGGYSVEEVAASTGRSEASVKRDWARARAFLLTRLTDDSTAA